jgi:4-nitrophenyl phosphatase
MKTYKLAIFDLDGTLYRGTEPIPHAVEAVVSLKKRGIGIVYLTNNSSQARTFYLEKLCDMGFPAEENEVYSSALGSASHLVAETKKSVFVVGMPGLIETLKQSGIHVVNRLDNGHAAPTGDQAEAVIAGICLEFTYALMAGAMAQIHAGAEFVATNTDATFPMEGGKLTPGAGSIVAAIQTCSGATPFVVGKPNRYLIDLILAEKKMSAAETLVIGDRLDTDILAGENAGCDTFLVLTGVEKSAPEGQLFDQDLRNLSKYF